MQMRAKRVFLIVTLVISASCSREPSSTMISVSAGPNGCSRPAVITSTGQSALAVSAQAGVPNSDERPWTKPVEQYVARLRAAFHASHSKAFADLLVYPVRVNTASRCTAVIPNAEVFIGRFDEIVRGRVAAALKASDIDYSSTWQGVSFGKGSVWIDPYEENRPRVLAFNSDAWKIDGLPCDGELETPVPLWLTGLWQATSVAILQSGQLVPRPPTTWIDKTVNIDVTGRTAILSLKGGKLVHCAIERFASRRSDGPMERSAAYAGLMNDDSTQFLDLKCLEAERYYVERVEVINRKALAFVGGDKDLLILRKYPSP
jgi:hypothetical protein